MFTHPALTARIVFFLLVSLAVPRAFAESAGLTTPGSATYPTLPPSRVSSFDFNGGPNVVDAGVTDVANGYTYLSIRYNNAANPGRIYKIKLGFGDTPPQRVSELRLNSTNSPRRGVLDPINRYAYFDDGIKIIKIALNAGDAAPSFASEFSPALNANEVLGSAAIDPAGGYLYYGTRSNDPIGNPIVGRVLKIAVGAGNAAPSLVGAATMNAGENGLTSAAIDPVTGYGYFGTFTSPGKIVKVSLGAGNAAPSRVIAATLLGTEEAYLNNAAIDASGYVYFTNGDPDGQFPTPSINITGKLIKLAVGVNNAVPVAVGTLDLPFSRHSSSAIDLANRNMYLFTADFFTPGLITKVQLGVGNAVPTLANFDTVGPSFPVSAGIDPTSGYLFVGGTGGQSLTNGQFAKYRLNGPTNPISIPSGNFIEFSAEQDNALYAGVDAVNGKGYFLLRPQFGGVVFQTTLGTGNAPPVATASQPITTPDSPLSSVLDSTGTYIYSGSQSGIVSKFNASALGTLDQKSNIGLFLPRVAAIDEADKYLYFANSFNGTGDITKHGTGENGTTYASLGTVDPLAGEVGSAVIDATHDFGYFGTTGGNIVELTLNGNNGPGASQFTSAAPGFALLSAAIDRVNRKAYFAGSGASGIILEVDISVTPPVVLNTLTLAPDETSLRGLVIDTTNKVLYVASNTTAPSKIVKIALPTGAAPFRTGAITLQPGDVSLSSGALDPTTGYMYYGTGTNPARVVKIATAVNGRSRASRILISDNVTLDDMSFFTHNATGKLRLGIYNNATPKQLIWQSSELNNAGGALTIPISSGTPSKVTLTPGAYWLAWQNNAAIPSPSFNAGTFGDGFTFDLTFGDFPATVSNETLTSDRWTHSISYTLRPTFAITGSSSQVAGASQSIVITAKAADGSTQTSYTGTKTLVATGANSSTNPATSPTINGQLFNVPITAVFTNGVATVPLALFKVETAQISVIDPALSAVTGTPLSVTVSPRPVQHFALSGNTSVIAGNSTAITLTAEDDYGNIRLDYSGSHNLTFTGAQNAPDGTAPMIAGGTLGAPRAVVFTSGVATVNATLYKAEVASIGVSEGAVSQLALLNITVQPNVLHHFKLNGNATQVAGTAQNITIFALDNYGNTATGTNGPLNITLGGATASPSSASPTGNGQNFGTSIPLVFVNGVVSLPIVLVKAEAAAITATSSSFNTPVPLAVTVSTGPVSSLTLTPTLSTQFQNASQTYTLASFDAFGNTATYTGTPTFTSSDTLAVLPATTAPFNATLRTIGNQAVTVTDSINAALTSTTIVTVNSVAPFSIAATQGTPQSATVGTAFTTSMKALVLDASSNPLAGVSVTFSAPNTGASGSYDGSVNVLTDGNGIATAPGFSANTLPGTYNVSAAVNALTASFALTNTVGAPTSITSTTGSNQVATVGATFGTALTATVRDQFGNPVPNVNVVFAAPASGASGLFANLSITTNGNTASSGIATASALTANTTPGTFTVTATAGALQSAYTLTLVNDAPVAATQSLTVIENNPLSIVLSATDRTSSTPTFSLVTSAQNGTVTGTPPNLVYTPSANYRGPDSFDFKASDGQLESPVTTIFITVQANTAVPTVTAISQITGTLNQAPFALTVNGTNFVNGSVVTWNGAALATTFVSATQLSAAVTATQLASAGQIPVAVQNPIPAFANSNTLSFFLYSGSVGTWIVTNTNDAGQGSLRLALASVRNGDTVIFDPTVFDLVNSDAETLINVLSELPALDDGNVTIDASNRRVSVNGSGANSARGLVVNSDGNIIRGLTLLGFARSGITLLPGSANNAIGGGRSVGGGPNGQGLRISGNGTYGIEILGAGTTGNTVKGCWIGLDAGGSGAQPNLAGVIIGDGATSNTVGSTVADEENIVSGNSLEGITVAGSGTDDNIIIGNTVGASSTVLSSRSAQSREGIVGRSAVANGSAGLFLSKGTNNTKNGGTAAGEGNNVAFNGGNGVEVRSPNARRNSARGNRVTANSRGGIALFDGSNDNIKAPVVESFLRLPSRSNGALGRSTVSARVKGSASGNGQIEFFNDSGSQGAVILGRSSVTNGAFEADIEVDDLLNLTATFTDTAGNTSPFGFFGRASGNAGTPDDTDGDGFSNMVETLAGTDPLNPAMAPTSAGALAVDSAGISLNFAAANRDSLRSVVRVALPDGFDLRQATTGLLFGEASKSFRLDSKLRSPNGASTVKATASTTGAGVRFVFALKNADLKAGLASSGLTDTSTSKTGDARTVAVLLTLKSAAGASYAYAGTVTLNYRATQGKSGKAVGAK